ncbi:MAG: hypothetical protein ACXACI_15990 [Candidatus Hodarchaeales archaeon]|jgi:hypothetical protein
MEKEEVEKAAGRLGVEKRALKWQIVGGAGFLAILLAIVLVALFLLNTFLRNLKPYPYPHVRSPFLPKNRFLAVLALVAQTSEEVSYGVFSRVELLGSKMPA